MNTKVEFTAWTKLSRHKVHSIFDEAFQQFHLVIEKYSRFDPNSHLCKLNNSSGKEVKVSKEFFKLVKFSLEMAKKTNGAFDPTIIDFLESYGYAAKYNFDKLKNKEIVLKEVQEILKKRHSYKEIELNGTQKKIKLAENQKIDLGSIGKGYAIDLAYKKLLPLENFLINAGGDIRAKGIGRDEKSWSVGLKVPKLGQIETIRLKDKAICCSGSWARKVKFFHHLIDPKTGIPQNDFQAVFVIADTAMEADAWATALFVSGSKAPIFINQNNLQAILLPIDKPSIKYHL